MEEEIAKRDIGPVWSSGSCDRETGKMLSGAFTLVLIANRLEKPLDYYIPEMYRKAQPLKEGDLSNMENELITQFRRIWDRETKELVIRQVKAAAGIQRE